MERAIAVLHEFRSLTVEFEVDSLSAVATSVVREACNGPAFVQKARKKTLIELTVISGEAEARLASRGALLPIHSPFDHALIFDIGGGSTEFILTDSASPLLAESIRLGVVHLTEERLRHDPPAIEELAALRRAVNARIQGVRDLFQAKGFFPFRTDSPPILIGIAGTPTTIAAIDLQMPEYDRDRITNHTLTRERIAEIFLQLVRRTAAQRLLIPGVQQGREDLIIPGIMITMGIIDAFSLAPLRVIDSGILEGIILSEDLGYSVLGA
jgi:exopolyphosphatase/guanosine-5'-triphosphate,3'-diphosphate pyrophosphatase